MATNSTYLGTYQVTYLVPRQKENLGLFNNDTAWRIPSTRQFYLFTSKVGQLFQDATIIHHDTYLGTYHHHHHHHYHYHHYHLPTYLPLGHHYTHLSIILAIPISSFSLNSQIWQPHLGIDLHMFLFSLPSSVSFLLFPNPQIQLSHPFMFQDLLPGLDPLHCISHCISCIPISSAPAPVLLQPFIVS